jgi:hypothetical protein
MKASMPPASIVDFCSVYPSALMMEAASSSEMSGDF